MKYDYLIVGAGFAGCVMAERLASQRDKKVLLIDKRDHIAGNAFDSTTSEGILIHHYGPHIFHTNDNTVFSYLSQFTKWRKYEHRVLSSVDGMLVPMPINRNTVNLLFQLELSTDDEVNDFFNQQKVPITIANNSKEFVISRVGQKLYSLLYEGYTRKQWGQDPADLAPSVCGRIPVRTNTDSRYFDDIYQYMPLHGYTAMFKRMISHKNIHLSIGTNFVEIPSTKFNKLIYTGPIDEYFHYSFGKLPYRSLRFEHEIINKEFFQEVASINYPNQFNYTRINEWKYLTGQRHPMTAITREYPMSTGEPYYPVPTKANDAIYKMYEKEAMKLKNTHFIGRLASYKYYNMDQVVAQSLNKFKDMEY
ncbi:MAG: UDP-galactopyranose mutase [Bacteroidota bacterium]